MGAVELHQEEPGGGWSLSTLDGNRRSEFKNSNWLGKKYYQVSLLFVKLFFTALWKKIHYQNSN